MHKRKIPHRSERRATAPEYNITIFSDVPPVRVWSDVDAARFRQIETLQRPALLRGLVRDWPAVAKARESTPALVSYLQSLATAKPVQVIVGAPAMQGRYFYRDDLRGMNFQQKRVSLESLLGSLLKELHNGSASHCYAGAVPVAEHMPGLLPEHRMELIDAALPRHTSIWLGNRSRIAAHWDQPHNIACVLAGRRRYVLFPIDQVRNLYFGPLDLTPAGQPISLVDFIAPDFARHPRFRDALAHAEVADLQPGDAIYIPSLWIHHAESPDSFGLMMNFWWQQSATYLQSPLHTLLHAVLTLRDLPPAERAGWRAVFDHYLFADDGDPMAHIPVDARGLFAPMTPERARAVARNLQQSLERIVKMP